MALRSFRRDGQANIHVYTTAQIRMTTTYTLKAVQRVCHASLFCLERARTSLCIRRVNSCCVAFVASAVVLGPALTLTAADRSRNCRRGPIQIGGDLCKLILDRSRVVVRISADHSIPNGMLATCARPFDTANLKETCAYYLTRMKKVIMKSDGKSARLPSDWTNAGGPSAGSVGYERAGNHP